MSMSISGSTQTSQSSSESNVSVLQKQLKNLTSQIQKLQMEDATKNAKQIELLEQQMQQIQMQIQQAQQKSQSQNSNKNQNTSAKSEIGPAYAVSLTQTSNQTALSSEEASGADDATKS